MKIFPTTAVQQSQHEGEARRPTFLSGLISMLPIFCTFLMGADRFVVGTFHVQRFAPSRYGPGGRIFALGESFDAKDLALGAFQTIHFVQSSQDTRRK